MMASLLSDDMLDDEPRFDCSVDLELGCSDLSLLFDKQERVFLLKCENEEGVSVKLTLTLHELEHAAIELLLAARARGGRKARAGTS